MLILRAEQMVAFRKKALERFERQMVSHLNRYLPKKSTALGKEGLGRLVREGMERARTHGFTLEYDMSRYIALMLLLGRRFDTDPELPWAKKILADEDLGGGRGTMDALYDRANQHLMSEHQNSGAAS